MINTTHACSNSGGKSQTQPAAGKRDAALIYDENVQFSSKALAAGSVALAAAIYTHGMEVWRDGGFMNGQGELIKSTNSYFETIEMAAAVIPAEAWWRRHL